MSFKVKESDLFYIQSHNFISACVKNWHIPSSQLYPLKYQSFLYLNDNLNVYIHNSVSVEMLIKIQFYSLK